MIHSLSLKLLQKPVDGAPYVVDFDKRRFVQRVPGQLKRHYGMDGQPTQGLSEMRRIVRIF